VLVLAVCAFTAAGHDSSTAIAEWAAGCSRESLLLLGGRPDPLTGRVRPPSTRTFRRVFEDQRGRAQPGALRLPGGHAARSAGRTARSHPARARAAPGRRGRPFGSVLAT